MRFKLDENLPGELVDDFRALGHEADTVTQEGLSGALDSLVTERARREGRVLLTMDKGIADVRRYPPGEYAGIVLVRPRSTGRGAVHRFIRGCLQDLLQSDLTGRLLVISESGFRIR